ncbi:MAG: tetratricopeptide repeat protein [Proteobacteria bacterium]|nr:tetratricopeptide repeat protein [Pseudomonadota bacterium]
MTGLTDPRVIKRFIILLGVATFIMFTVWAVMRQMKEVPQGDFEVRQGDIFLSDKKYDKAIERFEEALTLAPDHRGALGGIAVALIGQKKYDEAESMLTYLINYLIKNLEDDDPTGQGALSAAYGNRGIIRDRQGRYEDALKDYIESARVDLDLAEGPGVIERILYYERKPSSVLGRAEYLYKQLKLPKEQRIMRQPEEDEKQRVYKP